MTRLLRSVVIWGGLAAIILGCIAVALCLPAVQTVLVQQALGDDSRAALDGIHIGWRRTVVTGLRVDCGAWIFSAPAVTADVPLKDVIFHRHAAISRLVATDCTLAPAEVRRQRPAKTPALPLAFEIAAADVSGTAQMAPPRSNRPLPLGFQVQGSVAASRANSLSWQLRGNVISQDGDRRPLTVDFTVTPQSVRGTWKINMTAEEFVAWVPRGKLPAFAAVGEGAFEQTFGSDTAHVTGHLAGTVRSSLVAEPVPLNATFDLSRTVAGLHVSRFEVDGSGGGAAVHAAILQPLDVDNVRGTITFTHPADACARVALQHVPLSLLPGLTAGPAHWSPDGTAAGEVLVSEGKDGAVAFHSTRDIAFEGRIWRAAARLSGSISDSNWELRFSPIVISRPEGEVLRADFVAERGTDEGQPWVIEGRASGALTTINPLWREGSASVSAIVGPDFKLDGSLKIAGLHDDDAITASFHGVMDREGSGQLSLPVKLAFGGQPSDVAIEVQRVADPAAGDRWYVKASGSTVRLDDLRAAALPWLGAKKPNTGSTEPAWGRATGRITLAFEKLQLGNRWFTPADGTITLTHTGMTLTDGRVGFDPKQVLDVAGSVTFAAGEPAPYSGRVSTVLDRVDAGPLFPTGRKNTDPWVEGRFKVTRSLVSRGADLHELWKNRVERIDAESSTAIVRILNVNVGDAVPQHTTTVGQTVGGGVSSAVGAVFGTHSNPLARGRNPVSPQAEAVLQFAAETGEIGFDHLAMTAQEQPDHTYVLTRIAGESDTVKISGTGFAGGLGGAPLKLALDLSFRGHPAQLLAKAGLLPRSTDDKKFVAFPQPVPFGGTVQSVDQSSWHDLLAAAIRSAK